MENEKEQAPVLSFKKYAVARLLKYIYLPILFILFFIPIFPIGDFTSISAFQLWIGYVPTKKDEYISFITFIVFIFVVATSLLVLFAGETSKRAFQKTQNAEAETATKAAGKQSYANLMYITVLYKSLPFGLNAVEIFLAMMTTVSGVMALFYTTDFTATTISWAAVLVLIGALTNNAIASIICIKDFRLIREESLRFNHEKIEPPTISSNFQMIAHLFSDSLPESISTEQKTIPLSPHLPVKPPLHPRLLPHLPPQAFPPKTLSMPAMLIKSCWTTV